MGCPLKLILLHEGYKSSPQLDVVRFDGQVDNGRGEADGLREDIVPQDPRISLGHDDLLLLSLPRTTLPSRSGYLRVKGTIPLTAPVHTRPKTTPCVSRFKQS